MSTYLNQCQLIRTAHVSTLCTIAITIQRRIIRIIFGVTVISCQTIVAAQLVSVNSGESPRKLIILTSDLKSNLGVLETKTSRHRSCHSVYTFLFLVPLISVSDLVFKEQICVTIPSVVCILLDEVPEDVDEVVVSGHRAGDDGELQPAVPAQETERRLALLIDGRRQLYH